MPGAITASSRTIALRIGEDARPIMVASPEYLAPRPKVPSDLQKHDSFRQRFVVHRWSFQKRGRAIEFAVTGSPINRESDLAIRAAPVGIGVARVPTIYVEPHIASGRLFEPLEDRTPRSVGVFLCYPSWRQMPAALLAFIGAPKVQMRSGLHV